MAASTEDFLDYPKARCAVDGGDLIDCFDVVGTNEDGEKIVATLRRNPAGSVGGTRSSNVAFKSAISQEGFERDFMGKWRKRQKVQFRIKVPGLTWTVTGRYTKPQITSNVDNFIEFSCNVLGSISVAKV